jgi:hypothetical protein
MQNIEKQENLNKVYLKVYNLPRMISCYVDTLQKLVCKWNHCSLRVDNIVLHFFDDWIIPKWIPLDVDLKTYKDYDEVFVGYSNLPTIRNFTNNLQRTKKFDLVSRQMWFYTVGLWPKRNDCVDKCSATLTYLFNIQRCYTTPDKLVEIINEYRNKGIR